MLMMIRTVSNGIGCDALWLLSAGVLLTQIALSPSQRDAQRHGAMNHRVTIYAKRFAIGLCCLPLFCMGFMALPLLLIPLFIGTAFTAAARRRIDQGKVLWTLAFGVRSGSNLIDDLETIADGLSIGHRRKVFRLADRLFEGCSIDDALRRTPGVVPSDAVLAVRAGAKNGILAASLRDAAVRHTQKYAQNSASAFSPSMAMLYLVAVPVFATLILSGIMIYIIPKFKEIFEGFDTNLPELTVNLINISDWSSRYWYLFGPFIMLGIGAVILLEIAFVVGFGEFDLPMFGRWFQRLDLPNLLRIFASTIRHQRPLDEAVNSVCATHKRSAVRTSMDEVYQLMQAGEDPWQAMRSQKMLTQHEMAALRSAQRAGNLPWALEQLAESLERRLSFRWRAWLEFLQPLVVIVMGVGVGFICIALFLPLIKLLNDLS